MSATKTILITGASGQLGSELVGALVHLSGSKLITSTRDERPVLKSCQHVALDFTRPDQVGSVVEKLRPDLVLNAAAYTAVDKAESESDLAFRVNGESVFALGRAQAKHGGRVVHVSTDYVFDGSTSPHNQGQQPPENAHRTKGLPPHRLDAEKRPLNVYGRSKLAGESALIDSKVAFACVRTSWVYGQFGRNFFDTILRLAQAKEELRVVNDQWGAPTSAASLAMALLKIADVLPEPHAALARSGFEDVDAWQQHRGGFWHFSSSGVTNWHELAQWSVDALRQKGMEFALKRLTAVPSAEYPTPAVRPLNSRLDLSRWSEFSGAPPRPWQVSLEVFLNAWLSKVSS